MLIKRDRVSNYFHPNFLKVADIAQCQQNRNSSITFIEIFNISEDILHFRSSSIVIPIPSESTLKANHIHMTEQCESKDEHFSSNRYHKSVTLLVSHGFQRACE